MNPSFQIKSDDQAIHVRHHIAFMFALAGVGLLICWLSGGFPPEAWRTLFEIMSHIQMLWSKLGTGLLVPLLILVVQSCLIGIAWGILLWFFRREYTLVRAVYAGKSVTTAQHVMEPEPASRYPSPASPLDDSLHTGSQTALVVSSHARDSTSSIPPQWEAEDISPTVSRFEEDAVALPIPIYAQRHVPEKVLASPTPGSLTSRAAPLLDSPFEGPGVDKARNPLGEPRPDNVRNPFEESDLRDLNNPFEDLSTSSSTQNKNSPQAKKSSYFEELASQLSEENEHTTEQQYSQPASSPKKQVSQNPEQTFTEESIEENPSSSVSDETEAVPDNPFHEMDDMPDFYRQTDISQHLSYGSGSMGKPGENINPFGGNIALQPIPSTDPQQEAIFSPQEDTSIDIYRRLTVPMGDESIVQQAPVPPQGVGAVTHPGIDRAQKPNEDAHLVIMKKRPPARTPLSAGLFLVADGMGGHNDGRFASTFVTDTIRNAALLDDAYKDKEELKASLVEAIKRANKQLYDKNTQSGTFRGTTVSGALIVELAEEDNNATHVAYVVNVGDSRTYHFSIASGFYRVTRDHSTVESLIESGEITAEERYTDRRRNQIDRCLGHEPNVEVDVFTLLLRPMERLLLCSDGLWEMVRDERLALLLSVPVNEPAQIANLMLQAALEGGGHDNITAIVVQIP